MTLFANDIEIDVQNSLGLRKMLYISEQLRNSNGMTRSTPKCKVLTPEEVELQTALRLNGEYLEVLKQTQYMEFHIIKKMFWYMETMKDWKLQRSDYTC